MKAYRRGLSVVFLLVFVFIFAAYAQMNTADITGRITDEQGRVVPGATVTATNTGTGATRSVTTDDAGDYTITQLPGWLTVRRHRRRSRTRDGRTRFGAAAALASPSL